MALPSVSVTVSDQNFIVTNGEDQGDFLAGILIYDNTLIKAVGATLEVSNNYMEVNSLSDWWARLSSNAGNGALYPFDGFSAAGGQYPASSDEVRWPEGATGTWKNDWWTVHNYLQYGGRAVIGTTASSPFTSINTHNLNAVFGTTGGVSGDIDTILTDRDNDFIAVLNIEDKTISAIPAGANANKVYVYGSKYILPVGTNPTEIVNDSDYIETRLDADVVGCMARTKRVANLWYDPAGASRGIIIDGDNLKRPPTASEATTLYNYNVNPVLSFPGSGTLLFGNKTGATAGSIDDRIGASMLIIYLKKELGASAREVLFERNDTVTRSVFTNKATSILENVKRQQGITDYNIICDETNNTTDLINQGYFIADVFVKPIKSIEYLKLTFTNKESDTVIN